MAQKRPRRFTIQDAAGRVFPVIEELPREPAASQAAAEKAPPTQGETEDLWSAMRKVERRITAQEKVTGELENIVYENCYRIQATERLSPRDFTQASPTQASSSCSARTASHPA